MNIRTLFGRHLNVAASASLAFSVASSAPAEPGTGVDAHVELQLCDALDPGDDFPPSRLAPAR